MNVRFRKTAEADEDVGTARIVAHGRREIAAGAPLLPKDVVDRLAADENPVRVLRRWRGLTQQALSTKAGVSQSHIADIENGRPTGTPATLRAIATALQVPIDLLVP